MELSQEKEKKKALSEKRHFLAQRIKLNILWWMTVLSITAKLERKAQTIKTKSKESFKNRSKF